MRNPPRTPRHADGHRWMAAAAVAVALLLGSCRGDGSATPSGESDTGVAARSDLAASATPSSPTTAPPDPFARPAWLGTRLLPLRADGFGEILPTPAELVDRRLATPAHLPDPLVAAFSSTATPVPAEVVARSTWREGCPVGVDQLRYLTVTHWGFDGRSHTGELLVGVAYADDIVAVFRRLYDERFPIEEMRITSASELDAPPTGDGNNTESFVCRPPTGSTKAWSEHAYGRAIDINPFHNPYVRGEVVVPELASAYLDRAAQRPGMLLHGDTVVRAFADIGWIWGGTWRTLKDYMHFSPTGQ